VYHTYRCKLHLTKRRLSPSMGYATHVEAWDERLNQLAVDLYPGRCGRAYVQDPVGNCERRQGTRNGV
jgi:hypothetical protein